MSSTHDLYVLKSKLQGMMKSLMYIVLLLKYCIAFQMVCLIAMHASYMEFNVQSRLESKVAPLLCSCCWYTSLSYWIATLFKSYSCIRLYQLSVVVFSDKIIIDVLLINK